MVDIYMVDNIILLCSLKTYLSFKTWKHLLESRGYLIHLLSFFRRASKYPLFYISRTLVYFNFFLFFMNNFCIAPCLFSATKLWEMATRTWIIYLVDGKPIKHVFGVHSQCRSRTFLSGSRWKACFAPTPSVGVVYIWVVCTWSWF